MGRYEEIWGDMGRYGEIWGDTRRYEEIWGDMGRLILGCPLLVERAKRQREAAQQLPDVRVAPAQDLRCEVPYLQSIEPSVGSVPWVVRYLCSVVSTRRHEGREYGLVPRLQSTA